VGKPDFSNIVFTLNGTAFPVGDFINAFISFVLIAAAVYFFVVTPVNSLVARMHRDEKPADPTTKKCPECLSEIPLDARRCMYCTQPVLGRAA
jgi:large conductance mechanosensitive channel